MEKFWNAQSGLAKASIVIIAALLLVALVFSAVWSLRPTYGVLFAGLDQRDTALMVGELDKLKQPYRLEEGSILVPADQVLATRMKVMGKELPLHGAVGFELFNQSDFGVTEFAQKVNYQRALQGELTRTILSIAGVKTARVHLVLPEQGLFRKAGTRAKASVTVGLKDGATLQAEQVTGIQRLVSAAVPDVSVQDVTIVNQKGVALTRVDEAPGSEAAPMMSSRLEHKRATEEYLARKATLMLEQTYGTGNAMVGVDAQLNLDQLKVVTEDALPSRGDKPAGAGVMLRERETRRQLMNSPVDGKAEGSAPTVQREVDYVVGKRVEQWVTAPGAIKRLSISVVVAQSLDPAQSGRVQELVANAMGYSKERGDSISVFGIDQLTGARPSIATPQLADALDAQPAAIGHVKAAEKNGYAADSNVSIISTAILLLLFVAVVGIFFVNRTRGEAHDPLVPAGVALEAPDRAVVLRQIQDWLGNVNAPPKR